MASTPSFTSTPRASTVAISTANTNRDGTGTITSLMSGVAAGTRVEEVWVQATGATTAGAVRLFLSLDGGSTWRLIREQMISAVTPSTTVAASFHRIVFPVLLLRDSDARLGVSTHNAESFHVTAFGGDLT